MRHSFNDLYFFYSHQSLKFRDILFLFFVISFLHGISTRLLNSSIPMDLRIHRFFSFVLAIRLCFNILYPIIYTRTHIRVSNVVSAWCELETKKRVDLLFSVIVDAVTNKRRRRERESEREKTTAVGVISNSYCSFIYLSFCYCCSYLFNSKLSGKTTTDTPSVFDI